LSGQRLYTHFQPIVALAAPHGVFAHECLLRADDEGGASIPASFLFGVARSVGLLGHLDQLARRTAIRDAIGHRLAEQLFINFNPSTAGRPTTGLRSTMQALRDAGWPAERVVF